MFNIANGDPARSKTRGRKLVRWLWLSHHCYCYYYDLTLMSRRIFIEMEVPIIAVYVISYEKSWKSRHIKFFIARKPHGL